MTKKIICPQCSGPLKRVRQSPGSALNKDQFNAVKAGDWYCEACPDNDRGRAGLCYWRERELPDVIDEFVI